MHRRGHFSVKFAEDPPKNPTRGLDPLSGWFLAMFVPLGWGLGEFADLLVSEKHMTMSADVCRDPRGDPFQSLIAVGRQKERKRHAVRG